MLRGGAAAARRGLLRGGALAGLAGAAGLAGVGGRGAGPARAAGGAKKKGLEGTLDGITWPAEIPFRAESFTRYDESSDSLFYQDPRFVTHIDDKAIAALSGYYKEIFPSGSNEDVAVLDLCSSWISHFPQGFQCGRVAGLGMNAEELRRNEALTEYEVQDLNQQPRLPYGDNAFDFVVNAVSVDYLTKPYEVFAEIQRVLKPGGLAVMSFSNRCFPTKAISIWTQTGDLDHIMIVGSYFHYTPGFAAPQIKDLTPPPNPIFGGSDPMYAVVGRKLEA